jgi:hypothetical protein
MLRPKMGSQTDKLSQNALFPHKISLANQSTPQPDLIRRKSTHFAEALKYLMSSDCPTGGHG